LRVCLLLCVSVLTVLGGGVGQAMHGMSAAERRKADAKKWRESITPKDPRANKERKTVRLLTLLPSLLHSIHTIGGNHHSFNCYLTFCVVFNLDLLRLSPARSLGTSLQFSVWLHPTFDLMASCVR
jgi:hypothetical protein